MNFDEAVLFCRKITDFFKENGVCPHGSTKAAIIWLLSMFKANNLTEDDVKGLLDTMLSDYKKCLFSDNEDKKGV